MIDQNHWALRFLYWLGETNILLGFAAAASTLATYSYYSLSADYYLVAFIFCATVLTYNLQRRLGDLNSSAKFYKTKTMLMILAAIAMVSVAIHLKHMELAGLVLAGAASLGYAYPFIPYRGKRYSIRQVPYLKLWIIVLVWIVSTALVPLIDSIDLNSSDDLFSMLLFILQQGAFILALTVPFDVRDLTLDYSFQKTLPMVLGVEKSIKFAQRAMMVSYLFCFFNYLIGFFAFPQMLVQLGISFLGYFVVGHGAKARGSLYYSIVLDGMIILQGVAVFFV